MDNYRVSPLENVNHPRLENIDEARQKINILCGTLNPDFYNSPRFVNKIEIFLRKDNPKLSIIFNGKSEKLEEAIKIAKVSNNNLMNVLKKFPNKIEIYWMPFIAKRQYTTIDNQTTLIQGDHQPNKLRELYCFIDNEKIALNWNNRFEQIKKYSKKIDNLFIIL